MHRDIKRATRMQMHDSRGPSEETKSPTIVGVKEDGARLPKRLQQKQWWEAASK